MLTARIGAALALAVEAHDGDMREGTQIPYVSHPMAVAALAPEFGADEDQAVAALLHDAIEDGGAAYAGRILEQFGPRVLDLARGCTDGVPDAHGKKTDWKIRKTRYLAHLREAGEAVLLVSGAHKLHNVRAIVQDLEEVGQQVFDRFNASRDDTLRHYRELAGIVRQRGAPMAAQLSRAVEAMHALAG